MQLAYQFQGQKVKGQGHHTVFPILKRN